jgi:hypothetical protein
MIGLIWFAWLCFSASSPPHHHHKMICPGAIYFSVHGSESQEWDDKHKLLCTIGNHDFYR